MDALDRDPHTRRRIEALRARYSLPVTAVHGSLEGRTGALPLGVAIEPGGRHAAVAVVRALQRWDLDTIELVAEWEAPWLDELHACACVAALPGGFRAVDRDAQHWIGLAAGPPLAPRELSGSYVSCRRGNAGCGVARLQAGDRLLAVRLADGSLVADRVVAPDSGVGSYCFDDARRRFATAFWADVVEVWDYGDDPRAPRQIAEVPCGLAGTATALALAGEKLAVSSIEGQVRVGPWVRWQDSLRVDLDGAAVRSLTFTEDGATLVALLQDGMAYVDVATGAARRAWMPRDHRGTRSDVDPACGRAVSVTTAGAVFVVDPGAPAARYRASDQLDDVVAVAGTPDGRALVTASDDGSLWLRDRATGAVLTQMEGLSRGADAAAVTPDGREVLAASGDDGLVRWSAATGELLARAAPPPPARSTSSVKAMVAHLAVTRDGRRAVVLSYDSLERILQCVWEVDLPTGATRIMEACDEQPRRPLRHFHHAAADDAGCVHALFRRDGVRVGGEQGPDASEVVTWGTDGRITGVTDLGEGWSSAGQWSRDGGRLWLHGRAGDGRGTRMLRPVPTLATEREWATGDHHPFRMKAGVAVAASLGWQGDLLLYSRNGRAHVARVEPSSVLLGVAPDDRALWVLDPSSLVLELAVPDELLAP